MGRSKSIFLTLIVLISFVLSWPKAVCAQPFGIGASQQPQKTQLAVLCSDQGRFAFGQISDSSKDRFMLDTFTGRLWRIAETGEAGLFLTPIPYRISEGKYSPLPADISDPGSKKAEGKK
ncbi:MAG: hypothetical protein ABII26_08050 [Pseudomonadota bacterium]